jgi:hypothetical protein
VNDVSQSREFNFTHYNSILQRFIQPRGEHCPVINTKSIIKIIIIIIKKCINLKLKATLNYTTYGKKKVQLSPCLT